MARVARKTGVELGLHIANLAWTHPATARLRGGIIAAAGIALAIALATYNASDPSLNAASALSPSNLLGAPGATAADLGIQSLGLAAGVAALLMVVFGLGRATTPQPDQNRKKLRVRALVVGPIPREIDHWPPSLARRHRSSTPGPLGCR